LAKAQDHSSFRDPQDIDRVADAEISTQENAAVARLEQIGFARTDARASCCTAQPNVVVLRNRLSETAGADWKGYPTAQVEKWTGQIERVTPKLEDRRPRVRIGSRCVTPLTTPERRGVFSNARHPALLAFSGQSQTPD